MNKSLQIYWKDKSGTKHRFWIYPRGTKFEPSPGIYIYARETSPHKWVPIYIGQTENVNVRLTNHEQRECVDQNGATHLHVSIITNKKSRFIIEKDLIKQWKPIANTQFELIVAEVKQASAAVVARDEERAVYTGRYEAANATLLSELFKEQQKVQEQDAIIAQLKKDFQATVAHQQEQIEALTARLHATDVKRRAVDWDAKSMRFAIP